MRAVLLAGALLAGGCGTRGELYTQALNPLPAFATPASLVMVVPQTERLVVVTPGADTTTALPISARAHRAEAVPGEEQVVVLGGTPKAPVLDLVDLATGEVETLALPGLFDAVTFSPDARWAVLTYSAASGGGLVARNLNETALVDLARREVTRVQLNTESLAPRSVLFGPAEPDRQLVAVTLERGVAIYDALQPQVPPRRISIRPQGSQIESSVLKAVFSREADFLYIRASGLDDVITVELSRGPEGVGASINFLAGGTGLSDIALPKGDVPGILAVYTQSRDAYLLDPHGIQANNARLDLPSGLGTIHALQGSRAIFYSTGASTLVAWDFLDGRSGTAVLDTEYSTAAFSDELQLAVFGHPSVRSVPGATAALSVVSVEDDVNRLRTRIRSILLHSPLGAAALDDQQRRFFFASSSSEGPAVVTLNLASLEVTQLDLDVAPGQVLHLPEGDFVAAVATANKLGDVTLFPAGATERTDAVRFRGVALTGDLDRPREDAP